MKTLLVIAAALCSAATSSAQASWSEVTGLGTNIPATRRESPGAADLTSMYVFGGQDGANARLNDLWQFNGTAWTELTADGAAGSPPGRSRAAITWDHNNNQLLVFGGNDGATTLGDTWTWDTTNGWVQKSPTTSPPALQFSQAAYDDFNDNVLLFGGQDSSSVDQSDTWSWDGTDWTLLAPATVPPARRQQGMAARLDQDDIVMCCGQAGSTKLDDTYIWDGTDWNLIATTVSPTPRVAMDMTYDEVRQRVLIPGGNSSSGNPIGSIAEFDGTDWVNLPKDPVILKRTRYFLAFVSSLGRSYMFGGQQVAAGLPTGTFQYYDPAFGPGTPFGGGGTGFSCPCANNNDGSLLPALSGCASTSNPEGARLVAMGMPSVSGDDVVLMADHVKANAWGLFFKGDDQLLPGVPMGGVNANGLLQCTTKIKRFGAVQTDGAGYVDSSGYASDLHTLSNAAAGDTRHYQWWFRTPKKAGPCSNPSPGGSNTSNGYSITWGA